MNRTMTAALLLFLSGTSALADEGWSVVRREPDGLVLEAREAPPSRFVELRVVGHSEASPRTLGATAWAWDDRGVEARMVERRLVVSEGPQERVVWQVIRPPVVARRESLIRFKKSDSAAAVSIDFASEDGPTPERVDAVRVALVRGQWRFEVDPSGGTRVEHRCQSDPGGGVPAWLARGAQEDILLSLVREHLAHHRR